MKGILNGFPFRSSLMNMGDGHLKKVIATDPEAKRLGASSPFTHQKEQGRAIENAKRPETREKRIAAMLEMLRNEKTKK